MRQTNDKMLSVAVLCVCAIAGGVSARSDSWNFLDDKWLTARWDKFRDEVEEPGTWNPGKPFDQGLDPDKDPCLKIKCSRHKVCVAENYQTAACVSQRRVSVKEAGLSLSPGSKCKRCPVVHPSPVCGTDGHSYSTKCELEYKACISGKQISVKCSGPCPCPAVLHEYSTAEKTECSVSDLKEVVGRLRDWFRVLHENGNSHNKKINIHKPQKNKFSSGAGPICKDPLGWMFSRLDTNVDLQLDRSELSRLGLDRKEGCSDALFTSCDTHADTLLLSSAEWCTCFQRYTDSPCWSELTSINKKQAGEKLLGQYLPVCDAEGYYRSHQCHGSSGQCWCVDRYGNEVAGSRTHGAAECGAVLESSGDQGSGDSLFSDDDYDNDEDDAFVLSDQSQIDDDEDDYDGEERYLS
ncbi:testican-3-like isoform X1 [Coregonus clupeaformis]|uniref:testican-3-like isoform X1 n=1 Tax=Coregonus clupeaformis TaxID=59861 RepID=UPI001E1C8871|nr:testican-3-like isoform X1 [Coregonus clupeaformis]